jgi:uncharacterized membrane-anchored protein
MIRAQRPVKGCELETTHSMRSQNLQWKFHPQRDVLLAEAHARPSTPVVAPHLASRIATMSGEGGVDADRAHMAALCRKIGTSEPGPDARWCVLDGGNWRLRWERHTEISTWTVFCESPPGPDFMFENTALDLIPQDWLAALPGEILCAAHVVLSVTPPDRLPFAESETIAARVANGTIDVFSDFRPGPDSFTRFVMVQADPNPITAGRVLQQLFEIETYRLLALLAFPLANATSVTLGRFEAEAAASAIQVADEGGVEADRSLLSRLAALAGEAEAMVGATTYRFAAARAYEGLVLERIGQLREQSIDGRPTIADFMERRLAPAMRTCLAVAQRQHDVIERIARTTQMLNTRVEVASEAINVGLLASMDRRAQEQFRLQQTVEGLSVAAISYYALGLIHFAMEGLAETFGHFNAKAATGIAAPIVVLGVWMILRHLRRTIAKDE